MGKSFLLQITWPKDYPENDNAIVDMESFYNSHVKAAERAKIIGKIQSNYEDWAGMAMTFNIINYVLDNVSELQEFILNESVVERTEKNSVAIEKKDKSIESSTKGMTKGQKRRFYDKFGNIDADEKPRGWNWVDVIKHLNKTGS